MPICNFCNQEKTTPMIVYTNKDNTKYILLCAECMRIYRTCLTCKHKEKCDFELNTNITDPKNIQQSISTPIGVQTIMQPNPKRIEKTCKICKCADEGKPCLKQLNTCINWEFSVTS